MNDPHARGVLNSAAFHLGVAKPTICLSASPPPPEVGDDAIVQVIRSWFDLNFPNEFAVDSKYNLRFDHMLLNTRSLAHAILRAAPMTTKQVPLTPTTAQLRALLIWRGYDPDAKEETLDTLGQLDIMTMNTFIEAYKVMVAAA